MSKPLVIIVGPTSVGKSKVAIEVAKKLKGEIISGDSVQVYRGLDIGTAKVSPLEQQIIPHHLIDFVDPKTSFSVADFRKHAQQVIQEIYQRGRIPILVGGTGLYIRAVVDPYEFVEVKTDLKLREALQAEAQQVGSQEMHRRLALIDPQAARKIHPGDTRRIIRALEVYNLTGQPISHFHHLETNQAPLYQAVWIGLTLKREKLYQKIETRVDQMIQDGLVGEVKGLLATGVKPESNAMQALGYKEIIPFLQDEYDLNTAIELIKRNTRRFAKRQLTWFRRDQRIQWIDVEKYPTLEELIQKICQIICRTIHLNVE
ncbi:MAG: tRNA (adenosine(37)-N6)-dimethylallyltransferase MiaA [Syntrophomonadaceae bacterium]|nr:tRNA (adenosine(37)-N6)-dimethylallyltransferase MiaA [Syntrophomonadaceae bacterium]